MKDKIYDVVIWGATGFTGKLVSEYIFQTYSVDKDLKWAMAGRNAEKLNSLTNEIGKGKIPVIVADSDDKASLDKMTRQAKVICTTVGPYALYGSALVASCIENGADYCDLAGEVQWIRRIIDTYHEAASKKGVRIVNCCGFDSIPSDMGVFFLQTRSKEKIGEYCRRVRMRVKAAKGGFSGGTLASLKNVMKEASKDDSVLKVLTNPYGLNPDPRYRGKDGKDLSTVIYEKETDSWITPFVMAAINTKVVRRSHALLGFPYGENFKYDEAIMTGDGTVGRIKSIGNAMGVGVMMLAKPGSLFDKLLSKFMPKPGEGPSKKERDKGYFSIDLFGVTHGGRKFRANVKGDKDPGYGSTSKMLGECAVCLAKDKKLTPAVSGVLTPSVALGEPLIERLQNNAGVSFTVKPFA